VKNVYIFQVISKVGSFIGAKDSKRQTDQCPDVNSTVTSAKMMTYIVHLGMAVVTSRNTIIRTGCHYLVEFNFAIGSAFLGIARLQKSTAAATTVIIRFIRGHLDDIFFSNHRFNDESQVVCDFISFTFTDNLTGILYGELDFSVLVPVGINF
jgi:hypothetical protein